KAAALHALVLVVGQSELQTGLSPWGKVSALEQGDNNTRIFRDKHLGSFFMGGTFRSAALLIAPLSAIGHSRGKARVIAATA
ncbi:hypothetical protein, partial [Bradyrhizobium elkanii]|uniref:hypothetical protein n=1 Tax=Bradyrhizobium elkanii TaxID=29448 RepID=UPI001AED4E9F